MVVRSGNVRSSEALILEAIQRAGFSGRPLMEKEEE